MSVIVACECGKKFRAKEEHAGKRTKCPICGRVLVIAAQVPADPRQGLPLTSQSSAVCASVGRPMDGNKPRPPKHSEVKPVLDNPTDQAASEVRTPRCVVCGAVITANGASATAGLCADCSSDSCSTDAQDGIDNNRPVLSAAEAMPSTTGGRGLLLGLSGGAVAVLGTILLVAWVLGGDRRSWSAATSTNTVPSYRLYLDSHPKGHYTAEALEKMEELDWQTTVSANTVHGYRTYLQDHSNGRHFTEAQDHIDFLELAPTNRVSDPSVALKAFERYIALYPQGHHAAEVKDRADFLKAVQAAHNAGDDLATAIKAHEQYLAAHPCGQHIAASQDHVDFLGLRLAERNARNDPSIPLESFERYVASHPQGQYIEEVREGADYWRAVYTASRASDAMTAIRAYEQYLLAHPRGRHMKDVSNRIEVCRPVKPLGFFIAENVPGPEAFTFDFDSRSLKSQGHTPLRPKDKSACFLVVVMSIRSDQFMPSDMKYRQLMTADMHKKRHATEKQSPYPPKEDIRFYDPKRFSIVLSDGRAYRAEMFGSYSRGWLSGASTDGFIEGTKTIMYHRSPRSRKSPLSPDARETIALGFILDATTCRPPFQLAMDENPPIPIPDEKLPVPSG